MKQFSYVLSNRQSLLHKAIGQLAHEASRFDSKIQLIHEGKRASLAQGREVSALDMQCGHSVTVTVDGKDEEAAVAAIQNYFVANM